MLLKNCKIYQEGKEQDTDIFIEDGKIAEIGPDLEHVGEVLDLEGKIVLPGIIDPHVHLRDPGLTHKEDFYSGSCAAAAGGVTTFLDMPNTVPPTTTVTLLEEKRRLAQKSIINYGFHFGAAKDNIEEIKKARNIASVKVFMNLSTGKMMIDDDAVLMDIFKNSRMVTVHAEGDKVDKAISITKDAGNKLYLCHISQRSELDTIREEKDDRIFAEATPHHLFLNEHDDEDSFTRMIPGLKSVLDNEALMQSCRDGLIDSIGTDHAPHTVGEKMGENPPAGIPGLETLLPMLLDAVNHGELTIQDVQRLCCENPAKIFSIKNKGFIRQGYDADLVVIDMDFIKEVTEDDLYTKCAWSPFEGRVLKGWPILTIVNGNIVFDGEVDDTYKGREVEFE